MNRRGERLLLSSTTQDKFKVSSIYKRGHKLPLSKSEYVNQIAT